MRTSTAGSCTLSCCPGALRSDTAAATAPTARIARPSAIHTTIHTLLAQPTPRCGSNCGPRAAALEPRSLLWKCTWLHGGPNKAPAAPLSRAIVLRRKPLAA